MKHPFGTVLFDVVRLRVRVLTTYPFLWGEYRLKKIILFPEASCC